MQIQKEIKQINNIVQYLMNDELDEKEQDRALVALHKQVDAVYESAHADYLFSEHESEYQEDWKLKLLRYALFALALIIECCSMMTLLHGNWVTFIVGTVLAFGCLLVDEYICVKTENA